MGGVGVFPEGTANLVGGSLGPHGRLGCRLDFDLFDRRGKANRTTVGDPEFLPTHKGEGRPNIKPQ